MFLVRDLTVDEYFSVDNKYLIVVDGFNNKVLAIKKTGSGFFAAEDFGKIISFALNCAK
jgi:hypothetical protein